MELKEYQRSWKAAAAQPQFTIDYDALSKEVQRYSTGFQWLIFWRDTCEVGVSIFLIPVWLVMGFALSLSWTWYLTLPALIWVAAFVLIDRWRHPQRPSGPGEPLCYYAKESLAQVEHQIWLLRNIVWWYLLPCGVSIMAFFLHVAWQSSDDRLEFVLAASFWMLLLLVFGGAIYFINQYTVRSRFEPRRKKLLTLVASLEDETNSDDSGDIMELVSALAAPTDNVSLSWESWAENWNRIIPSWRMAVAVILPTLVGAFCGWQYALPDLGPVFFQSVVAAVIPFEIALGYAWLRCYQKQKRSTAAPTGAPADGHLCAVPRRFPRAPAAAILVLTLTVGMMALLAVYTFAIQTKSNPPAVRGLDDVSAFAEDDIARLDAWLQRLSEGRYPSLSAVIVRDGEVVYQGVCGLEDIRAKRPATLETEYHVASVTKSFTATLAVILHDRGVIDLDQPVVKYLPSGVVISTTPEIGSTITLRQLASHMSGLPSNVPGQVQTAEGWYELEPQRLYDHLAVVKLNSEPGAAADYSNLGFGLLGHALELAAQQPLDLLMQEQICDPMKLTHTAIQVDDSLRPATGYAHGSQRKTTHSFKERLAGSGGLVTSVGDLAKFLTAQMQPGVLSDEILETLHTEAKLSDKSPSGRALGWAVRSIDGVGPILKKNGGRNNCSAWIGFSPKHGVGVAIVTNCGGPDVDPIGYKLLEQSIPLSQKKPVTSAGYAKVAPFTGVRWEDDQPIVCVAGNWGKLVSIDNIPISRIMKFATEEYDELAHKRFSEDLVEVLSKMGHDPDWKVSLAMQTSTGQVTRMKVIMTDDNRRLVRE